jgi:hypothetical protein
MVSHMFLRTFAYLYTLCILVACSASSDENELRTWIDVQGRTMQAELIDVDLYQPATFSGNILIIQRCFLNGKKTTKIRYAS